MNNNSSHEPPANIYPKLSVTQIQDPSRFYAVPILGIVIKCIMLFPLAIELFFLWIAQFFLNIINSFFVLFTGKYWDTAYAFNLGILRLTTKYNLFFFGLTNAYPGFGFTINDPLITFDMAKPEHPSRFFAIPLLGGLARFILMIPYLIYVGVITNAAWLGSLIISFRVLFVGKYPESVYEIARDSVRVSQASSVYFLGLSDSYPSFWISMNHQTIKLLLIIFSILFGFGRIGSGIVSDSILNSSSYTRNNANVERSLPEQ